MAEKMSFFAYGYIQANRRTDDLRSKVRELEMRAGPRLRDERIEDLHNFPPDLLPDSHLVVCFSIDDGPGRRGVEYLLDGREYAPDAEIGLPTQAFERLGLLIDLLQDLVAIPAVARLAIALTDSDEIERVKHVGYVELRQAIVDDCSEYSPPNVLYVCDAPS